MSQRDGWSHLYLYDGTTGRVKNQITKGNWVVRGVAHVDEDARQIVFMAGGAVRRQDPYFVQYYRINFDGTGLTPLTTADGYHTVTLLARPASTTSTPGRASTSRPYRSYAGPPMRVS